MRRLLLRRVVPGLAVATIGAACEPAGDTTLEPGRYAYEAAHPTVPGDTVRLSGVLEITEGAPELDGYWDVPQLHPELDVAAEEDDTFVLTAQPTYFGTLLHRVTVAGGRMRCEGTYTWVAEGGIDRTLPVRCSISRDVPPGTHPGIETPETDIIRPAEPVEPPIAPGD